MQYPPLSPWLTSTAAPLTLDSLYLQFTILAIMAVLAGFVGGMLMLSNKSSYMEMRQVSEQNYKRLFNNLADPVIMYDFEGNIVEVNEVACVRLGCTRRELLSMSVGEIDLTFDEYGLDRFEELRVEGRSRFEATYFSRTGGEIPVEVNSSLIVHDGLNLSLAVVRDTVERRRAEHEISEYMESLELAEQGLLQNVQELKRMNKELDDFTRTVSHDLKSPLRNIIGMSMLLSDECEESLDETGRMYLQKILDSSVRMSQLIDSLMTLSQVGRKQVDYHFVDVNNVISTILHDLSVEIEEKNAVIAVGDMPRIVTQGVWVKQLFSNLISNAIKFNESSQPVVEISFSEEKDGHYFEVMDNGIGIPEEGFDDMFSVFHRVPSGKEYPGTGVGLAVCKKITDCLGGSIGVTSKPGVGTTFNFMLPRNKLTPEAYGVELLVNEELDVFE